MADRYPLSWPFGWKRVSSGDRTRAKFSKKEKTEGGWYANKDLTIPQAMRRLIEELNRLGAYNWIVSSNIEIRLDGGMRSDRRAPDDPGVAVYFKLEDKDRVLACDKWDQVAGNLAAIAAHIDAIRRQDRYGVGTLDQAFAGYDALPAPGSTPARHWSKVLEVVPDAALIDCEAAYKRLARERHPDTPNGSTYAMSELNVAIAEARKEKA